MEVVLKLVRTYRFSPGLADRLALAEELFAHIKPDLRFYVFASIRSPAAEDVLQEILKSVATGLHKFAGDSTGEFWAWCYRIARSKLADYFQKQSGDRLQPMPPEELWQLVENSAQASPLSHEDRDDLDYALRLLAQSKPECKDFLWKHFVIGLDYAEIAAERSLNYDAVRMKIGRCLDEARSFLT